MHLFLLLLGLLQGASAFLGRALPSLTQPRCSLSMCGIVGIQLADHRGTVAGELYDALTLLQHRGQTAAGMATAQGNKLHLYKDTGLVRDVFAPEKVLELGGECGIGHVRYPTAGQNTVQEAQPLMSSVPVGMCLTHNGHLTNAVHLSERVSAQCHLNTDSDSEVLLQLVAQELREQLHSQGGEMTKEVLFETTKRVVSRCRGGFAVVLLLSGYGVLAFRDPHGIRPLSWGGRQSQGGSGSMDWAVASESAALSSLGFELKGDVQPGEAVFFDRAGAAHSQVVALTRQQFTPCLFEYVYMARPDSILNKVSVYAARVAMGKRLADQVRRCIPLDEIDVVVPVPETSRISALHLANALGLPYEDGLTKNRYIGRTFIMPGQEMRTHSVRKKLCPVHHVLQGRRVLLIDDSIVRGTTSREIVKLVRGAGAVNVYFGSASPPVRHSNVYGIDLPSENDLIAVGLSESEVAEAIGADRVVYQRLEDLEGLMMELNPELEQFESSIFDGEYVTNDVPPLLAPPVQAEDVPMSSDVITTKLTQGLSVDII